MKMIFIKILMRFSFSSQLKVNYVILFLVVIFTAHVNCKITQSFLIYLKKKWFVLKFSISSLPNANGYFFLRSSLKNVFSKLYGEIKQSKGVNSVFEDLSHSVCRCMKNENYRISTDFYCIINTWNFCIMVTHFIFLLILCPFI